MNDPGDNLLVKGYERVSFGWIDNRCIIRFIDPAPLWQPAAPHIWVPKLTLPEAAIVGAAAAVIRNPVVSRRFWAGFAPSARRR